MGGSLCPATDAGPEAVFGMSEPVEFGVAVIGFGTVGAGVVDLLTKHQDLLTERAGLRPLLRGVGDLDLDRPRGVRVDRSLLTRDVEGLIRRPDVHIVVETVGGTKAARDIVLAALRERKPVVTANKALLAEQGPELFQVARDHGAGIYFEASVAGGVPVIRAVREGLVANRIARIYGILNGTCNYILTRMEEDGATFDAALQAAQQAGYAETDPSLDVDGIDTAHKAVILASLACGRPVPFSAVGVEGIRSVATVDLEYARTLGYSIKLMAVIRNDPGGVSVHVGPCLVPRYHLLGQVRAEYNAVLVRGDAAGDTVYCGRGAGRYPTASAIVSDIMDAARRRQYAEAHPDAFRGEPPKIRADAYDRARWYIRLMLMDRPGMLARAADVFGRHEISLASVVQREGWHDTYVPVLFLTHPAMYGAVRRAVRELARLEGIGGLPVCFRIEDLAGDEVPLSSR